MKKIIYLLCFVVLFACTFQVKHRGYIFPKDFENSINSIKTTKQLKDIFGSPLVKTIYGQNVWVYAGTDENYRGPFKEKYTNTTVLFALVHGNNIIKMKILKDKDLPKIKINDDETQVPNAIDLNAFEELFNNIGRFKPAGT